MRQSVPAAIAHIAITGKPPNPSSRRSLNHHNSEPFQSPHHLPGRLSTYLLISNSTLLSFLPAPPLTYSAPIRSAHRRFELATNPLDSLPPSLANLFSVFQARRLLNPVS